MEEFESGKIEDVYDEIGDENVYTEQGRERLLDEEELTDVEDAFMQGYELAFE